MKNVTTIDRAFIAYVIILSILIGIIFSSCEKPSTDPTVGATRDTTVVRQY